MNYYTIIIEDDLSKTEIDFYSHRLARVLRELMVREQVLESKMLSRMYDPRCTSKAASSCK